MAAPKLTKNDARIFAALAASPEPLGVVALHESLRLTSINLAAQSVRRLVILGLCEKIPGVYRFGRGSSPCAWRPMPGAVFPGVAPRKFPVRPERVDPLEIPQQSHRRGSMPASIAAKTGLAGLVQQVSK